MTTNGQPIKQEAIKLIVCLFLIKQIVTTIQCSSLLPRGHNIHVNGTDDDNNDPSSGFKVIKEVTVEEIIDLPDGGLNKTPKNDEQPPFAQDGREIKGLKARKDPMTIERNPSISQRSSQLGHGEEQLNNRMLKPPPPPPCQSCSIMNKRSKQVSENLSSSSLSDNETAPTSNVTQVSAAVVRSSDPVPSDTRQLKQLLAVADDGDGDDGGDLYRGASSPARRTFINNQDGLNGRTRINLDSADDVTGGYARTSADQALEIASLVAHHKRDKIGLGVGDDRLERFHTLPSAQVGGSKVIFIPDRIILAEDIIQPPSLSDNNADHHHHQSSSELQLVVANAAKHLINHRRANQTAGKHHQFGGKPDPRCPRTGAVTLEHPGACDKYYYCQDGLLSEHTCPNGLLYGTRDTIRDFCVYRWTTTCGNDKSIPNPISSPGCRWQYGIFTIQGSPKCSPSYYECADGKYTVKRCSLEDQVYDDRSKSCKPFGMVGCSDGVADNFHCPPDDQSNTYWPFPRYFLNDQTLIHCVNERPELVKCGKDEKVDPEHLHCVPVVKRIYINKKEPSELSGRADGSRDSGELPADEIQAGEEKLT